MGDTGATWRMQFNRPRAAVMRPYVKLLTLTTCFIFITFLRFNVLFYLNVANIYGLILDS